MLNRKAASIQMHTRLVKKVCDILKRIIHFIKILACQELSYWGQDETENSKNKDHFLAICKVVMQYDACLR